MRWLALTLVLAASVYAQTERAGGPAWHGVVVDPSGVPIPGVHIYERPTRTKNPVAAVVHIADSDDKGRFLLPLVAEPQDVLVFAEGFNPWVGFITSEQIGYHSLTVKMQIAPCNYPDVQCDPATVPHRPKKK